VRYLVKEIERVFGEENRMVFVAGPRQVGKTTLLRHLLTVRGSPTSYFNWDIARDRKIILNAPDDFWSTRVSESVGGSRPLIGLDEIHKFPRWKRFLKGLFDAQRDRLQILVTGSGRLDVYQKGGDSLFGRYALFRLHPFTLGELLAADRHTVRAPEDFWQMVAAGHMPAGATEALGQIESFTGFPEPLFAASSRRLERWRRERRTLVFREDLRDLSRVRDLGLVDALVSLLPERIGSPLSVNALREDLGVSHEAVRTWLSTLERLYFLFEIRPYAGKIARALRREGKVYLFDPTEIPEPGARFENLVALHLRKLVDAWNDWGYGDFALHYVRNKEKKEVDFLITDHDKPYALIEAKLSDSDLDPSLRYYAERLLPPHAVQVVRHLDRPRLAEGSFLILPAAGFFSTI
jgi:predicted AAA+ superfamily ATPase